MLDALPEIRSATVIDPLAWLEANDAATASWRQAQADRTASTQPALVERDSPLSRTIHDLLSYTWRSVPLSRGGRYFFLCSPQGAERPALWLSAGPTQDGHPIVDPALFDQPDGLAELGSFWPSPDGRHVILAVTRGGRQKTLLVVLRIDEQETATIHECLDTPAPAWAVWRDATSFFWSRRVDAVQLLSLRRLDGLDTPVSIPCDGVGAGIVPIVSDDGAWLLVLAYSPAQPEGRLFVAANRDAPLLWDVTGIRQDGIGIGWWSPHGIVLLPQDENGLRQVVELDLTPLLAGAAPRPQLLHRDGSGTLTGACSLPGGDILLVERAADGGSAFRLLRRDKTIEEVAAPGGVALADWTIDRSNGRLLAKFGQWDAPSRLMSLDPATARFESLRDSASQIALTSSCRDVIGPDGVAIPVTIITAANRPDGQPVPCLLWGYGAGGISITPGSLIGLRPWLEAGGMIAVAHVRGGGERGPRWHQAGRGANKHNTFADMISVARWLVAAGHTQAHQLCLWGSSAGGLLVLGAATLAPDICAAVIAMNPLADMAKFTRFQDDGSFWTKEFGDPDADPAALARAAAWSPLHNLKRGQDYPATLIQLGCNDDCVSPVHGRKMTAALQATGSHGPHLLLEKPDAGHGGHGLLSETAQTWAQLLEFAAWRTGLDWETSQPPPT